MAVSVHNFLEKNIRQPSIKPMPHFPFTSTVWWNSQEEQFPEPLSNSLSLKVGSSPQKCQIEKYAYRQSEEQDSSSTQSTYQSHQEVAALGRNSSQDQCISSNAAHDKSYGKHVDVAVKPVLFLPNPSFGVSPSQVDINPSMAHIPYTYGDPYVSGLYTTYGPQTIVDAIQPSLIGLAPARVPLPIDLPEDGPIYVNAKQYNGILRRRQIRARLEAQNKLLKNRKPYLHESRHRHALNRVRGSGGRFLSTKKVKPSSHVNSDIDSNSVNQTETGKREASSSTSSSITHVNGNHVFFQQADHMLSNISPKTGGSQGLVYNGTQRHYPVVL